MFILFDPLSPFIVKHFPTQQDALSFSTKLPFSHTPFFILSLQEYLTSCSLLAKYPSHPTPFESYLLTHFNPP
jgi:hypothetical protein